MDLDNNPSSSGPSLKQRLWERVSLFKRKNKDGGPRTEPRGGAGPQPRKDLAGPESEL